MSTDEGRKSKRERSPTYPAIDLALAIRRAGELQAQEGFNWAPIPALLQAWGYSSKSSNGALTVAALKRYGLIEDRGSSEAREGRLTAFARAILLDEREDSPERLKRLQEAALKPKINREIWDKYEGSLPSDVTLKYHLTVERGFSPGGAEDYLRQFRRTIEFARLTGDSAIVSADGGESSGVDEEPAPSRTVPQSRAVHAPAAGSLNMPATAPAPIQFPVVGATIVLQTTAPLTEEGWDQMMAVLGALKPAIVSSHQDPPPIIWGSDDDEDGDSV